MIIKNKIIDLGTLAVNRWQTFWFGPVDLFPLAAFRFCFGIGAFIFYSLRQLDFAFLFSERGILPYNLAVEIIPDLYRSPIPWVTLVQPASAQILHICFLLLLLALAFGLLPRFAVILTFFLHLAFINRNILCIYGADQVACCWLFCLCFMDSNRYLRIPRRKGTVAEPHLLSDAASTLGFRLLQIQLCVIYAYSGTSKLQGRSWWQGDAIWNILANGQLVSIDFSFLRFFPSVVALLTFLTMMWETYFPILIWFPRIRKWCLLFGAGMHIMIGITMGIPFFSVFMICSYLLWTEGGILRRWFRRIA